MTGSALLLLLLVRDAGAAAAAEAGSSPAAAAVWVVLAAVSRSTHNTLPTLTQRHFAPDHLPLVKRAPSRDTGW